MYCVLCREGEASLAGYCPWQFTRFMVVAGLLAALQSERCPCGGVVVLRVPGGEPIRSECDACGGVLCERCCDRRNTLGPYA
jgi:hypothetical protein